MPAQFPARDSVVFWKRERKIKVELLAPISLSTQVVHPKPDASDQSRDTKTNTDLAFKLVATGALSTQAGLVVYGYSVLVGYYEKFGIDINEIALSTPTLLLYGYINILSGVLTAANSVPIIGPGLVALIFIGAAAAFVSMITKQLKAPVIIGVSTWIGMTMFLAFMAPALGVKRGITNGLDDFREYTNLEAPNGLKDAVTVITDKGVRLVGHLILVDSKSTFLLVDKTVFKIDGSKGRVIRETELSPKGLELKVEKAAPGVTNKL
ncbi:hypothetical protein WIN67_25745 [Pseudomonas idahonensis]|uniref:hypothetical protein n=1 Tax=Pseudomonas idahonensis TaxID=2942628 RepID=UPI0030D048E5